MDKSLDEVIKENPKQFSLRKGRQNKRGNTGKNGKPKNRPNQQNKNNNSALKGVSNKNGGRIAKQNGRQTGNRVIPKGKLKRPVVNQNVGKPVFDARNKLLAKNRQNITDARDRIAALSKKTDLRQKLSAKKPETMKRTANLKAQRPFQGVGKITRDLGRTNLTRTIIGRTVENELARFSVGPIASHYLPPRYDLPPPPQFYPYHRPEVPYIHSTAAMDCEPPPSAMKRIQPAEKRLGPREPKSKPEQGYKVFVNNLHHKVTQEDIVELFGDVGDLLKASLLRPGMAEVVYIRRDDAMRAVDVYHNRQLDGLPMHCSVANAYEPRREPAPLAPKPPSFIQGLWK